VIERLLTSLRALAADVADERVRADAADAVRLTLDCPQHDLTSTQRARLRSLGDVLDDDAAAADAVADAARAACAALGIV